MTDAFDAWMSELAAALEIDVAALDPTLITGVSRLAHGVDRSAAPVTVFMVGLAAGLRGGGAAAVKQAVETAARLGEQHNRHTASN